MQKHVAILKSRSGDHGGLEKYASRIALAFAQRGAKVSILTTSPPLVQPTDPAITFYPYKTSPWPPFLRMEEFDHFVRTWLKKNKADLIFGMDRNRLQTHIRAGNGVHAAYLKSRIHTEGLLKYWLCTLNPLHRKIMRLEKEAFESPSLQKLFTNSHMIRNQILERFRIDPAKVMVIHNGVEWHEMEADFQNWEEGKKEALSIRRLRSDCFHFLFIGNGYLRKGLVPLLEGLSRLKKNDFHLSIIGKDNKMELYQAKAIQLGLKDNVTFFGPQKQIRPFYQYADALVIPSFYDPFANVTIEALAMGLFVVSSKENGGHEILNQKNGIVIENLLDSSSVFASLQEALKHKKTKTSALSARESVRSLDFSRQLNTLIDACE